MVEDGACAVRCPVWSAPHYAQTPSLPAVSPDHLPGAGFTYALAHVKWFAEPEEHPLRADLIFSERTLLVVLVATLAVLGFTLLERLLGDANWPRLPIFRRMAVGAPTILAVQAAITLVAAAAHCTLLMPNFPLPQNPIGLAVAGVQLLIALSFVTGIADWAAAVALIALTAASGCSVGGSRGHSVHC